MRLESKRIRQILTACAIVIAAGCGKDDRITGGTNGTEAENALAIVLRTPDGSPAIGARVVVRPFEAIDSSSSGRWLLEMADSNGRVSARIPSGQWTLEARLGKLALQVRLTADQRAGFDTTLRASHPISGVIVGVDSGTRVYLPGLATSVPVDANGAFRFPDVPPGIQSFQVRDVGWTMPDSVSTGAVTVLDHQLRRFAGSAISVNPTASPVRIRIPDSLVPAQASFMDASGSWIPTATGIARNGFRQIWMGASSSKAVALASKPEASASPFQSSTGMRLAWIPEVGPDDQTGNATSFAIDSSALHDTDSIEGPYVRANLGRSLGTFAPGTLPDTGAFTVSLRTKILNPSIGSLWLLDWTDSVQNGIRIGIGGDRLRLVAGMVDTSIALPDAGKWSTWAARWDGRFLSIWSEGIERIHLETVAPSERGKWTIRKIGSGGALALNRFLAWNRIVDGAKLSAPPLSLP